MDIKDESKRIYTLCQGCLSADRKLTCITGQNKALFIKLREDVIFNENDTRGLLLCWECVALLNKMKYFQARIKTAQFRLVQYLQSLSHDNKFQRDIPHTLSPLIKTKHKDYDQNYNYIYEEDHKETYFEQDNLQAKIHEQEDLILDQKQESDDERLLVEIKKENNEQIKEEFDNDSLDNTEYYEPDLKQEIDEDFTQLYPQKKKTRTLKSQLKKYEQLATVTTIHDRFSKNVSPYYETVFVNSKEVEQLYMARGSYRYDKTMPYQCVECKIGYKKRLDYLRHQTFNHSEPQYPTSCLACKREVLSPSHLEDHWTNTHNSMLQCTGCGELSRTKGEVKKHLNRAHTKKFSCARCALEFRTLGEFSKHYKMAHERVTCDYCNKNVCSKRKLEGHIKRQHLPGHCSICNKQYPSYYMLERHLSRVHPELVPHLSRPETRQELRYCVECDRQYPTVLKYKRHLQQSVRHRPPKRVRIPCPACDKKFSRVSYKNNHYRLVHVKETKHYCELCNKYFANGYGVRTHIQHVHQKVPKIKDKICDLCGRGFHSNRILVNHRRTHTGERPFKCPYCPASFAQKTAMMSHQKSQHKNFLLGS